MPADTLTVSIRQESATGGGHYVFITSALKASGIVSRQEIFLLLFPQHRCHMSAAAIQSVSAEYMLCHSASAALGSDPCSSVHEPEHLTY